MRTHPLWGTDDDDDDGIDPATSSTTGGGTTTRGARVGARSTACGRARDDATGLGFVDWAKCPPAADPAASNKRGGAARGRRKRLQVESFRAVVCAAATTLGLDPGGSKRRPTIVDFGCGTGNLLLPLAAQHPEADFVGLDLNPRSIDLLSARARDAGLANVAARVGLRGVRGSLRSGPGAARVRQRNGRGAAAGAGERARRLWWLRAASGSCATAGSSRWLV